MSNWIFLERYRVTGKGVGDHSVSERYWSDSSYGFNGMFRFYLDSVSIRCIASDGEGWRHVSVSIEGETKPPKWDMMCKIKDLFWNDECWVVQFHPAKSDYVNNHPGCLHLWEPTTAEMPKPNSLMVGFKSSDLRKMKASL